MIRVSGFAALFLLTCHLNAYDLNAEAAKLQQRASGQNINGNIQISDEMLKRAQNVGYTFDAKKPEIEKWKDSMSYEDGKVVFNQQKKTGKPDAKKHPIFAEDERVYIFISSSIPKQTLIEYAKAIDAYGLGNHVVMVMRGCIGGCEKIRPTLRYINDVITDRGNEKNGLKAQVWIDPLLFRRYGITSAPVFVYAKGVNTQKIELSEGMEQNLRGRPVVYKSEGDWDIETHLKTLYQKSKSPSLQKLIARMNQSGFFGANK